MSDKLGTFVFLVISALGILYVTFNERSTLASLLVIVPIYLFGYFQGKLQKHKK